MENVAHTLTALVIARAGLARSTPLATTALVVGANLPDADLAWSLGSELAYLHSHRGWTHSFAGVAVATLVLWVLLLALDRLRRARSPGPRARPLVLLGVSAAGVASHFLLDFMNPYGIRPCLPWSGAWVYGDLWHIVDPWLWLVLGTAAFVAGNGGKGRAALWSFAAVAVALLMAVVPATLISGGARAAWILGIAVAVAFARRGVEENRRSAVCRRSLAVVVAYGLLCAAAHGLAVARLGKMAAEALTHANVRSVAAIPRFADPLRWDGLIDDASFVYHRRIGVFGALDPPGAEFRAFPKRFDDPRVRAILESCAGEVILDFFRFPFASIDSARDGTPLVMIRDARFTRGERDSFGAVPVPLGPEGRPRVEQLDCPLD